MPISVMVKGVGKRLFPDDMAPDQIKEVLRTKFSPEYQSGLDAGLDMSTAAMMARAKEQGFGDQTYYHGTADDISAFDVDKAQARDFGFAGKGIYITPEAGVARSYANTAAGAADPNIIPLKTSANKTMRITLDYKNKISKELGEKGAEALQKGAIDHGFDSIEVVTPKGEVLEKVVFDPKNIRSVNATFDPAKQDSANLLAGSGALAVGAGAMGSDDAEAGGLGKAAQASAKALEKSIEAKTPGLKLSLGGGADYTTLSKIIVPKDQRNLGTGSKVMDDVAKWADETGEIVALTPSSDFGGNKNKLTQFYKRFGFVENKGRNKDYAISEAMYRLPATGALLAAGSSSARADSKGTIQGANVPELQQAADILEKLELPVIGKPFQGLADWARGAAYNDRDKLKRALVAALDLI